MDRSIDLERLLGALAGRSGLPTAQELQDRMGQAEVQLILRRPQLDQQLLDTGWYLHAVASVDEARERYTPQRQRQAFQVSAHIFDLALAQTDLSRAERLSLGFAAAIGYRRGGRDPNATAILHRLGDDIDVDGALADHLDTLPMEVGLAFVGFQPRTLFGWLRRWRGQLAELAEASQVPDLSGTVFGPAQVLVLGAEDLLWYFTHGDASALERGRARLRAVALNQAGPEDLNARWVAAHLLTLSGEAQAGSLWNPDLLPPDVPPIVRQAFTVGSPPVLALWEPQRDLLTGSRSPFSPEVKRMVLAVPTSGGKTLLAQLLAVEHLERTNQSVCYVAPTRSLCREVRRAMAGRVRILQREAARDLPDFPSWADLAALLQEPSDVEVMTPERLANLLRHDSAAVLDRFGLFIFDEAQLLKETGRGFVLESVIALLDYLSGDRGHRIVLISAAMGNAGSVAQWLDPQGRALVHRSSWRGPRRLHAAFTTHADWSNDTRVEHLPKARTWPYRLITQLSGQIRLRLTDTNYRTLVTTTATGWQLARKSTSRSLQQRNLTIDPSLTTKRYKIAADMIVELGHAGSVLAVANTRRQAQQLAHALAANRDEDPATTALADFVRLQLGDDHPLTAVLPKGVGFHHAGLPSDVLEALEDAVRDDTLAYLTCTSTLTDGINLPVRTVVIYDQAQGLPDEAQLRGARLVNAIGRAGRAGRETEGWIVLVRGAPPTQRDFTDLNPSDDDLAVTSSLTTPEALETLALTEMNLRHNADALFTADGAARDFIGFVWLVLAIEEEQHSDLAALDIDRIVQATLAAHTPQAQAACRSLAAATRTRYLTTDPQARRRWPRTGTSIGSARILDDMARSLAARIIADQRAGTLPDLASPLAALQILDDLDRLLTLPEAPNWRFRSTPRGADLVVAPMTLLTRWLTGSSLPTLADTFLPTVSSKAWRIEQMVDTCSRQFEHYLSWTVGALVELVNTSLAEAETETRLCPDLGSYIRYGVSDPRALALMASGIRSRRLVHALVADMPTDLEATGDALRAWIARDGINHWRTRYNASAPEILDLLDFTRVRNRSLLRTLLETGAITLEIPKLTADLPDADQTLTLEADRGAERPAPLAVYAGQQQLATVAAQDQADLAAILDTGLDIRLRLRQGGQRDLLTVTRSVTADLP